MATELKLSEDELKRALELMVDEGYSYYFPTPFELEALLHVWDDARPCLARTNLLSYQPNRALALVAPKSKCTVRTVQLLDPVDLLYLTGLVLRIAPTLERVRVPASEGVVHSFRVTDGNGGRLRVESSWDNWAGAIRDRLNRHEMVAKADIVDFFPRVYLHRLKNSLVSTTEMEPETKAIMRLVERYSHGTSYGIPIGPTVCNLLAEALLVEVDDFLRDHRIQFVRYIDDYVFFADSEAECLRALYLLGERLDSTQGLSLNMAKTKVLTAETFAAELAPPEDMGSVLQRRIIEEIFRGNPYAEIDPSKMTEEQKELISQLDSQRMLELALEGDIVDLRAVKFVLNVLAGLKRPQHIDAVLHNLDRLQPVSEVVARFLSLIEFDDDRQRIEVGDKVVSYVRKGQFVPDFQSVWLLDPFARSGKWNNLHHLRVLARDSKNGLVRRQAALALGQLGNRSALLDLKSRVDDAQDWERRAIIFACRGLPKDEREAFWRNLKVGVDWRVENVVLRATIEYARSQAAPP